MTFLASKMNKDRSLLALVLALLIVIPNTLGVPQTHLRFGFYSKTCPEAASVIRKVVQKAVANDSRNAAILLRLHFHDCFVQVSLIFIPLLSISLFPLPEKNQINKSLFNFRVVMGRFC